MEEILNFMSGDKVAIAISPKETNVIFILKKLFYHFFVLIVF